jgi:hypothetical protein
MDSNSSLRSSIYSAFLVDKPNITQQQSNDVGFDKQIE